MTDYRYDELDEKNCQMLKERVDAYESHEGLFVGDYLKFSDGTYKRIAYIWYDGIQPTYGYSGSFYLGIGYASMSGSLDSIIPKEKLSLIEERKAGKFWFFHHDIHTAHNGIDVTVNVRVWKVND